MMMCRQNPKVQVVVLHLGFCLHVLTALATEIMTALLYSG